MSNRSVRLRGPPRAEVRTSTEPIIKLRRQAKKGITFVGLSEALDAVGDLEEWLATSYVGEKRPTAARRRSAARWLDQEVPASVAAGLHQALGDEGTKLEPLAALVRCNDRNLPEITPTGGRYVAPSSRRVATGAYYTPRSLTEEIVRHTLEALVYRPGPLESLDSETWVLRPSTDLLALRVADIAMGSGAFLVAVCRYLADRVIEAWDGEGDLEASRTLVHRSERAADAEVDPVVLRARRLVAEHCLYGVDVNPLAVEMAKMSLWLVTMDRERPFGFLNDRFVCGDSLLGLSSLAQLEALHIDARVSQNIRRDTFDFAADWRRNLAKAADIRRRITATSVVTVRDVEHKTRLLLEAQITTEALGLVADALTGAGLRAGCLLPRARTAVFAALEGGVLNMTVSGEESTLERLGARCQRWSAYRKGAAPTASLAAHLP